MSQGVNQIQKHLCVVAHKVCRWWCSASSLGSCLSHVALQVCCGSGLQRIYEFLQTDEHCARPDLDLTMIKVSLLSSGMHAQWLMLLADMLASTQSYSISYWSYERRTTAHSSGIRPTQSLFVCAGLVHVDTVGLKATLGHRESQVPWIILEITLYCMAI